MILCCVLIKSRHRDEHGSGHGDLKTINSVVYILSHLGNQQHVFMLLCLVSTLLVSGEWEASIREQVCECGGQRSVYVFLTTFHLIL